MRTGLTFVYVAHQSFFNEIHNLFNGAWLSGITASYFFAIDQKTRTLFVVHQRAPGEGGL